MKITYLKQNNQGNNSLNIISSHRARNIFDRSFSTVTTTIVATTVLMKVKEESKKIGLKLNIQKMKIVASGPITSWQIDGETVETVTEFIWGSPKSLQMVTAAMTYRHLLLGRKVMINLVSILNSRDIAFQQRSV